MSTTINTIVKGLLAALKMKIFFVFAGMAVFLAIHMTASAQTADNQRGPGYQYNTQRPAD
jgi:hypothetical protein